MNCTTKTRSNYFSVTDYDKLKNIVNRCRSEDDKLYIADQTEDDGSMKYALICDGDILGFPIDPENETTVLAEEDIETDEDNNEMCDYSYSAFLQELMTILPPDDAIILTSIGYEGMRSLAAWSEIITAKSIKSIDLVPASVEIARKELGNETWETENSY